MNQAGRLLAKFELKLEQMKLDHFRCNLLSLSSPYNRVCKDFPANAGRIFGVLIKESICHVGLICYDTMCYMSMTPSVKNL